MFQRSSYDAVVVGSDPNGFSAGIALAQAGCSVVLLEGQATVGGGVRSAELTLPGLCTIRVLRFFRLRWHRRF